jgi:uncharacterized protein with von Willebrand factor type A (vWA) domain
MARGAVVVIISDGWDTGDPNVLRREMERLSLVAFRIVWVNHGRRTRRTSHWQAAWPRHRRTATLSSARTPSKRSIS